MKITLANLKDVYRSKKASIETMELKGYTLVSELFVDSSGFGMDYEPALTSSQFEKELTTLLELHGTLYTTVSDIGMFQVYVSIFKKTGHGIAQTVGANRLHVIYSETKHAYRLYDTDIVTFDNGLIILDTGGWDTPTTTKWMSKYLPNGYVYRKNWQLYASYNGQTYKFNGNRLELEA